VKKETKYHLDIEIDKLTNSILNTISGDSFPTDVYPVSKADLVKVTKRNGWLFSWSAEMKQSDRQVYKLTIRGNIDIIQGLASISDYSKSLGAVHVGGHKMVIFPDEANKLINRYYPT
jgi:hypothetical protein